MISSAPNRRSTPVGRTAVARIARVLLETIGPFLIDAAGASTHGTPASVVVVPDAFGSVRSVTINVGDKVPDVEVRTMGAEGPQPVHTGDVLGSGRVVLFAVPGAFTPGCSKIHMPGFVKGAADLKGKGVDR